MADLVKSLSCNYDYEADPVKADICRHILFSLGTDPDRTDSFRCFKALAYTVRDQLVSRWIQTQRSYYDEEAKLVYYLSLEFLLGRLLGNSLINLDLEETYRASLSEMGFQLEEVEEREYDAGLGNGGLGRLAACFLDSMATLGLPAYGYGIRYDYGMFYQRIIDGYQVEQPDNWLRYGNPWEIDRPEFLHMVHFGGRVEPYTDAGGALRYRWVDTESVLAMPCDILIPGYRNENVISLRLWAAKSTREFNLDYFQKGNYVEAIEEKARTENISKVLYPSEQVQEGRALRLKQEYFFVSATFQDILRRYRKRKRPFEDFPSAVAIQLNDTHPAIAIPELMRILVDEEGLGWEAAWRVCVDTFGYTNHTVMPEALESWPVSLMGKILPRHLEIIYEINRRFLEEVQARFPGDTDRLRRMSLIEESPEKRVRMAHLAIVGSHSVNGVAEIHTQILTQQLFRDFYALYPERFNNKTNGITPRRWLLQANPGLAGLISEAIGPGWATELDRLEDLVPFAEDAAFRARWRAVKHKNKVRLAAFIQHQPGSVAIDPDTLFDVHVKRIHEYKRQLLNVLHVVTLYRRIVTGAGRPRSPRTVLFGGKAAPGYAMAKLIIKLINAVAQTVNATPAAKDLLKIVFVPNYCVSSAEKIIPAAELSEQISTAGTEASGTGNMKLSLNGALTIGTLDGANIEIADAVGRENVFLFGLDAEEAMALRERGYNPWDNYYGDAELKAVLDAISGGSFSPEAPDLFRPLVDTLLWGGDPFLVLADYRDYIRCQEAVGETYQDQDGWTHRSILNVARMGRFSSDATIRRYAEEIWQVHPTHETAFGQPLR